MAKLVQIIDNDAKLVDWNLLFQAVPLVPFSPICTRVLYSALTTSYAQILSSPRQARGIQIFSSLSSSTNVDIGISFDGVTDGYRFEAGEGVATELKEKVMQITPGQIIYAKYYTSSGYVQPTAGTLRIVLL